MGQDHISIFLKLLLIWEPVTWRQRLAAFPSPLQILTMKPIPEKTTSDLFSIAPRASTYRGLSARNTRAEYMQMNRRIQILAAMISTPALSGLFSHACSADCRVHLPFPTIAVLSPSTTGELHVVSRPGPCLSWQPWAWSWAWVGGQAVLPAQFSQVPVPTSMSAAHTSGSHTQPSESKKGWPRPAQGVLKRRRKAGAKVPTHRGFRAGVSSQGSLMTAYFSPRVSSSSIKDPIRRSLVPIISAIINLPLPTAGFISVKQTSRSEYDSVSIAERWVAGDWGWQA